MVINLIAHPGAQVRVPVRGRVEQEQRPLQILAVCQPCQPLGEDVAILVPHRGTRGQGPPVGLKLAHALKVVLQAQGQVTGNFLLIAEQQAQLAVAHRGIVAIAVGAGIVIAQLDVADAGPHRPAQAGAEHRQRRKPGPTAGRISPGRALPEAVVAVERDLVGAKVTVQPGGPLVVFERVRRAARQYNRIAPGQPPLPCVEERETAAVDEAIRVKPGGVDKVKIGPAGKSRDLQRVRGRLEVLHIAADKKRDPVLGKQIVDEHQVAGSPG